MARNVEIKARIRDFGAVQACAQALSGKAPQILDQEDVFFASPQGRLKLRTLSPNRGELIYYERPDQSGPRISTYSISHTNDPAQLRMVLGTALGEKTIVRKRREVYLVGATRIHLDKVEGLGEFIELEVVLNDTDSEKTGQVTAFELMTQLGLQKTDLIESAYADLVEHETQTLQ